jgi:hypothetical protein
MATTTAAAAMKGKNMSEHTLTRIQLNIVMVCCALLSWLMVAVTAVAQLPDAQQAAKAVAGLTPVELIALVAILAIALCGYLIRLLFGRMMQALDANTKSNSDVARLLAERPCIRNPSND